MYIGIIVFRLFKQRRIRYKNTNSIWGAHKTFTRGHDPCPHWLRAPLVTDLSYFSILNLLMNSAFVPLPLW